MDNTHLQKHLVLILDSLQKCKSLDQATRKRNLFQLQKEDCAPSTQMRIAGFDNRFCREIEKSIGQAKFTQTLSIWKIHVPNDINDAIVIPTISGECTTHRNCSQKCHTCKQQKIDSCREV